MAKAEKQQQQEAVDVNNQAREQTGRNQVRLRFDRKDMSTSYANAFRTSASAEEVIIEFGLNQVVPNAAQAAGAGKEPNAEIIFQIDHRMILNYYTAKRLALTLGQIVRRHEEQFGDLKLNAQERMKK